ncbi:TadE/TadG family type IV pilus assembly protein [Variovorax boronicumulans]
MRQTNPRRQHGLAAIEFALVFVILFLALYGIVTFGVILYTQQVVSRSAEDGARAALQLGKSIVVNDPRAQEAIYEALASGLITPTAAGTSLAQKKEWLRMPGNMSPPQIALPPTGTQIVVTVRFPFGTIPVLPTIPAWTNGWIPDQLTGKATAARPAL